MTGIELFKNPMPAEYSYEEILLTSIEPEARYQQLHDVANRYGLHPLTIEDFVRQNQRSKIEVYPEYVFFVWHYYSPARIDPTEVHIAIRQDSILVVATGTPSGSPSWRELFFGKAEKLPPLREGLLRILDVLVDQTEDYLDKLMELTSALELDILDHLIDPKEILTFKTMVRKFDQKISSSGVILSHFSENLILNQEEGFIFRDIMDHFLRIQEHKQQLNQQLIALFDVYWGSMGARTNEQMRALTTLGTLFIPLSFWSGFFGMNFESLPFKSPSFFVVGMLAMLSSLMFVAFYLIRRGLLFRVKSRRSKPIAIRRI